MRRQCPKCKGILEDTAVICPRCGEIRSAAAAYPTPAAKCLTVALAAVCCGFSGVFLLLLVGYLALSPLLDMMSHFVGGGADFFGVTSQTFLWAMTLNRVAFLVFGALLLAKKSWKIALTIAVYSAVWLAFEWLVFGSFSGALALVLAIPCTICLRKSATDGRGR